MSKISRHSDESCFIAFESRVEMIFSFYVSGIHDAKRSFHSDPWLDHFSPYPLTSCSTFRPRYLYHFIIPAASSCSFLVRPRRRAETRSSCSIVFLSPKKTANQPFLLSLSVALSYQIDELVGRRRKECWISYLYDRESVDAKNSSVSPFVSTVAGTYIGFAVEHASIWDGSRLFTTGEQKNWRVGAWKGCFFLIRVLFIFFVSSSFELLLSSLQKEFVFAQCTQVERNVCQDSDITVNKRHPNFFPLNLYE